MELPRSACRVSGRCDVSARAGRHERRATDSAWGDEPAHGVAGVDVEDDVEVEPGPFVGAGEFGDVPGPHLVRSVGHQLGFDVGGVTAWRRRSRDLVLRAQIRYMVDTEPGSSLRRAASPRSGRAPVAEPFGVQHVEDLVDLGVASTPGANRGRRPVGGPCSVGCGAVGSGGTGSAQCLAGLLDEIDACHEGRRRRCR